MTSGIIVGKSVLGQHHLSFMTSFHGLSKDWLSPSVGNWQNRPCYSVGNSEIVSCFECLLYRGGFTESENEVYVSEVWGAAE